MSLTITNIQDLISQKTETLSREPSLYNVNNR